MTTDVNFDYGLHSVAVHLELTVSSLSYRAYRACPACLLVRCGKAAMEIMTVAFCS